MKTSLAAIVFSLAVAATALPTTVSAVECSNKHTVDGTGVAMACPTAVLSGEFDVTKPSTITNETLDAISDCKSSACIAEIKKIAAIYPDCTTNGYNAKAGMTAAAKLCEAFAKGPVTPADAIALFEQAREKPATPTSGAVAGAAAGMVITLVSMLLL